MKIRNTLMGIAVLFLFGCISSPEVDQSPTVEIENNTPYEIVGVYYAENQLDNWTDNLLDQGSISPGETYSVTAITGSLEFIMEIDVFGEYYAIAETMDLAAGSSFSWKLTEESIFGDYTYDPYSYLYDDPYAYMDYYDDPYAYMDDPYAYLYEEM